MSVRNPAAETSSARTAPSRDLVWDTRDGFLKRFESGREVVERRPAQNSDALIGDLIQVAVGAAIRGRDILSTVRFTFGSQLKGPAPMYISTVVADLTYPLENTTIAHTNLFRETLFEQALEYMTSLAVSPTVLDETQRETIRNATMKFGELDFKQVTDKLKERIEERLAYFMKDHPQEFGLPISGPKPTASAKLFFPAIPDSLQSGVNFRDSARFEHKDGIWQWQPESSSRC